MQQLLVRGAQKTYEEASRKYENAKSIEKAFDKPEIIVEFFEIVYDKFEKDCDNFIDSWVNEVQDANAFYKLKTKVLDKKMKGLETLVVK